MYASVSLVPFGISSASRSISTTGSYSSRNHAWATSSRESHSRRAWMTLRPQASTASASAA